MKIERLEEIKISDILDELSYDADLCQNILLNMSEELLTKVLLERGSCYEIGIVGGDAYSYEWVEEVLDTTTTESDAIEVAENIVNSGKYGDYTVVILQIPDAIDDMEIDADVFEVWRYYIPESSIDDIDEETIEKFRKSFKNFFDNAHPNDYDSDEEIAWAWATDVDDVEIPEYFCDEDGNVEDEDELSDYLYQLALDFLEE